MTTEGVSPAATVAAVETSKPWEQIGISRATWYRYGKPDPSVVGKKPPRVTQKEAIRRYGMKCSVRSFQRYERASRLNEDVKRLMRAGLTGTALFVEELALLPAEFVKDICEVVLTEAKPMELGRMYLFFLEWKKSGNLPRVQLAKIRLAKMASA
jgi:hypothetical protein